MFSSFDKFLKSPRRNQYLSAVIGKSNDWSQQPLAWDLNKISKAAIALKEILAIAFCSFTSLFAVNTIALCHGSAVGWLSPALVTLTSDASPLVSGPITVEQMSWIGANLCFGGVTGTFLLGYLTQRYGCRIGLLLMGIPNIVFWIMVELGCHYHHLYVARVVAGLTGGPLVRIIPLFISEVVEKE